MRIRAEVPRSLLVVATYPFRPAFAAVASLKAPFAVLAIWVVAALASELSWLMLTIGVLISGGMFLVAYRRVRARTLTIDDDGLTVQRDAYRLVVPWGAVTGVERRRHQRVFDVEELVVSEARVVALDRRGKETEVVPDEVGDHPALKRVLVSAYDEDWREGPIGEQLRARGVI